MEINTSKHKKQAKMKKECILPGPVSLNARREGNAMSATKNTTFTTGRAMPSILFSLYALPKEKPREIKKHPTAIPAIKPKSPTRALRSPPANLNTILNGQPRKVRAPIITKKPRINLIKGLEPPRGLNSPLHSEIKNDPNTIPIISGLMYCTTPAECIFTDPAISLIKQDLLYTYTQ